MDKVEAMAMKEENPIYVKFLKNKEKIEKNVAEKSAKAQAKRLRAALRKNKSLKLDPFTTDDDYDETEYLFLCFVTRKYFKDCAIISVLKGLFGIIAIIVSILMENVIPIPTYMLKSLLMTICFGYGLIMLPLSFLYFVANLYCYCTYSNLVSTRTSVLSKKINHFYDSDTDKFVAVNWANVFSRDKMANVERRRARGW